VSRAFTDPGAVKAGTLARIHDAAQSLDYVPNALARAMITKRTENLGFIIHEEQFPVITNPFYGQILESIVEYTGKKGYSLFISSARDLSTSSYNALLQKQVDGVIFASYTNPHVIQSFLDKGIPVVLVNYQTDIPGVSCILSDDFNGIREAVTHLASAGHRSVGFVEGRFSRFIRERRHEAFVQALRQNGLHTPQRFMAETNPNLADAYQCVCSMLGGADRPTAIVCTNDLIAVAAIKAARYMGLAVPGDIAVTGYDNSELCAACDPTITSVDVNTADMGRLAAEFLLNAINGKNHSHINLTVRTRLVKRESA
jgi:DNA-binding LacI/PurR family transcriptional regulator